MNEYFSAIAQLPALTYREQLARFRTIEEAEHQALWLLFSCSELASFLPRAARASGISRFFLGALPLTLKSGMLLQMLLGVLALHHSLHHSASSHLIQEPDP